MVPRAVAFTIVWPEGVIFGSIMTYHVQFLLLVRQPLFDRAALPLTQTSWVLPPLSVGKMTLRLYGALNYRHGFSKGPSFGTGRHVCTSPTANSASTASHQTLGFSLQRKPCHHKAKRDEQTPRRQEFDAVIAHRPAHPRCSRRGEGDAEEDHGVECRGERRRDQRRPPPAYPSKAVEDGNVCELPHKEGRTRGRGDPGRSDDGGESDRQRKSHVDYTSGGLCTESPVGEVGDQESERVREGTPGEPVVDGVLNGDVGHDDGQRHGQNSDGVQVNVQQYTELLIYSLFQKVRVLAQDGVFVTIEVWSRLWPSTVTGRRSYRNTHALFRDLSKRMNFGRLPLIVTDGFEFYQKVIRRFFGPACLYGQVLKTRRNDRIIKVERRALHGAAWRFEDALNNSEDSSTLNTAFIERLNLAIRQSSAYLSRRTLSHARSTERLDEHLELLRCYYTFVRPHGALKFGREIRTPAMQAGLTTRRLTFRDIFFLATTIPLWSRIEVFLLSWARNPVSSAPVTTARSRVATT